MDRVIVYPGAVPLETDILNTNKFALAGLAKLAKTLLGSGPLLVDFTCTPTAPASLNVQVSPGQIYQMMALDSSAYSSLAADAHQVLKQGILWDAVTLSCPAPTTPGYSINYLIEIGYFDTDTASVVLPYYNASTPNQPYSGPNNSGTAQNTVRQGQCSVQVKAGAAATTGTQATPSPDAGYLAAFVVTVAYGQSTITSSNIAIAPNAPIIQSGVAGSGLTQTQADARYQQRNLIVEAGAAGTLSSNAYIGTYVNAMQVNGSGVPVTLPGNCAGSYAVATAAATAAQTINILKMTAGSTTLTTVGTITYAAGAASGTFSTTSGASVMFNPGDALFVQVGSTADKTLANAAISLFLTY